MPQNASPSSRGVAWLWPLALVLLASLALVPIVTLLVMDAPFLALATKTFIGILLAALAGVLIVGVAALWTRLASPKARKAATKVALARAQWPELPDDAKVTLSMPPPAKAPALVEAPQLLPPSPAPQIIEGEAVPTEPVAPVEFSYGRSRLEQLVERGHVARSGDSLLVGYDAQLRPRYIEAAQWGLMIVAGQSGKGKSSVAALIISQAALMGWDLLICDPAYHRPRSLLREYLAGMSGAIYRQAVRPPEIAHTVSLATKIARRRIDTGERPDRRVLLVVDDFSVVAGSGSIDGAAIDELALASLQASAAGVHTLLLAHDMTGSWFGGQIARRLRDAGTHRLILNMSADAARPILPSADAARQVAILPPGRGLYFDGSEEPALLAVPQLRADDLVYAAQGRPPRPYQRWEPGARPMVAAVPVAPPQQLAPTEPIAPPPPPPRAAPPTVQLFSSVDEAILEFLTTEGGWHTADSIARGVGANAGSLKNKLPKLVTAGLLRRRGPARGPHEFSVLSVTPAA